MRSKLISGLIILFFILNTLTICWDNGIVAIDKENYPINTVNVPIPLNTPEVNWSKIEVLSEPVFGKDFNIGTSESPKIVAENDKLYVVWMDQNNTNGAGTDSDIFYLHYDGFTWGDVQVISEPVFGKNYCTGESDRPRIAVEKGSIYVVWHDANNTDGCGTDWDIFYRANLTGNGWEDIQVISEPVKGQNYNINDSMWSNIAVEDGNIYIAWQDGNDTNGAGDSDEDTFYICNLTGTHWEPVQVISEPVFGANFNTGNTWGANIAVENGNVYVIWGDDNNTDGAGFDKDIFYRANLTGSSWEDIQIISEPIFGQDFNNVTSEYVNIEVVNSKIYVTWRDENNTNGAGTDWDVFYRCNITGTGWEPVQVISEPVPGQNLNIRRNSVVKLAVWEDNIYSIWMGQNDTDDSGTDWDIHFRCNLSGSGWGDIEVISEPVIGQNFNTGMSGNLDISIDKGNIYTVWMDKNNTDGAGTDYDVFFRQKIVNPPSLSIGLPKVTPKVGNTSTDFNFTMTYLQLNNTPPSVVRVIIDDTDHFMLEVDQLDTNCTNGKEYYFTMNNLEIGKHTYEFNTSDGINYTNTLIFRNLKVLNTAPKIITQDNLTAVEDVYYEVIYEYEDIDVANVGQVCSWEYSSNANWLNFDIASGKLFGTPTNDDVGQYWVDIAVDDTIDIVSTNFTLTVLDVNDRPIIETSNVMQTKEDELYEVDYNASDIDSQIVSQIWTLETNAISWLNISSSGGILNGTPGNDDVGAYWVNVTVNDTEGGYDFTNFTLTVLNVNDNPYIITDDVLLTGSDILYEVQYNATDIDSPSKNFIWSLSTNATWLSIDPNTGVLSGTPTRNEAGSYSVNVTVSDGDGGTAWDEFVLTVYRSNLAPRITNEDIITIMENKTYYVDYNATDDQPNHLLEWSLNTNASWLRIDTSTGVLSGIPTSDNKGKSYWVNVTVVDTKNSLDFHNFTLTVLPEPKVIVINNVPQLTNIKITPAEGDTNTEFVFSITYTDEDENPPEFIQIVIDGVAFDLSLRSGSFPYFGIYEYKTTLSTGEHSYYFVASDGSDTNTTETFTTPSITPSKKVNGDDGTEDEGLAFEYIIMSIIIIIIIILIVIILMVRKKKIDEPESVPPSELEYQEPITESETTPSQYPAYQPEEPMVQEDLYYSPPAEESEQQIEMTYQQEADQEFSEFEE